MNQLTRALARREKLLVRAASKTRCPRCKREPGEPCCLGIIRDVEIDAPRNVFHGARFDLAKTEP